MTLKEAEQFYKQYRGLGFFMWREESQKYEEFNHLNISSEIKQKWDRDIIDSAFLHMWDNKEQVWIKYNNLLDLLAKDKENADENGRRLLEQMKQMVSLDKHQKLLIIESMAGRTGPQEDGGCYFFCTYTKLAKEMNEVMEKLMEFTCDPCDNSEDMGPKDLNERLQDAKADYRTAYRKFNR